MEQNTFKKINKILLPYFILLIFIYLFIYFKFKEEKITQNNIHNKKYLLLILLMVIFSIIWFLKVPVYRYGYSYFISFLALGFAYLCTVNNNIKKNAYKFFIVFLILSTIGFTLKNLLRIFKSNDLNNVDFFPKIIYTNKSDVNRIESNKFFYYESVKMCGYSYAPCTHYLKQKLKTKKYYNYKVILAY